MYCATVLYANQKGRTFDFKTYAEVLAPEYARLLGDNCVRFEVRRGLMSPGAPEVPFLCIASFWVESREKFGAALSAPGMQDLMTRISALTDAEPIRQFDEVLA